MYYLPIVAILVLIIVVLLIKIHIIRNSLCEIAEGLKDKLSADTNTLIDISSRDKYVRKLTCELNIQLRLLRKERYRYLQGDLELKEAITNISHDIRTPLTAISGYLQLLDRESKSENVERYITQVKNRTDNLKSLTDELFLYSMVTSRKKSKLEKTNVAAVLEESLISFYALMKEKNTEPVIELPSKAVYRYSNAGELNRIFSNILGNALKYTDGDIEVVMDEECRIVFTNSAKNLNAVDVGRLFDRFYTVEYSRNSTGLGLSIAKLLTERLGGNISAEYKDEKLSIKLEFPGNVG